MKMSFFKNIEATSEISDYFDASIFYSTFVIQNFGFFRIFWIFFN